MGEGPPVNSAGVQSHSPLPQRGGVRTDEPDPTLRRVSIPANIAEDCGRSGEPELARFCHIALGSASKLEYHLVLARDLGFLNSSSHEQLAREVTEVKRMLTSFMQKLTADR